MVAPFSAILYALFGGVFFLSMVAVLLTPVAQHLLHRFHLELDELEAVGELFLACRHEPSSG